MKRLFDILFSLVALVLFAFPAIVISLLLKMKERHPIVFIQERIGKHRRPFRLLKFQTMVDDVPTGTGKILRKTGLDELPQFLNVLKGDMSIVGPRALTQGDIERLGWSDPYHQTRWEVNPGITGFAQLYGGQHRKTSWFWDIYYLDHNNVIVDFCIVIVSFMMNFCGKKRVRQIIFQQKSLR
jgi:lipopolysaccharide/colanic/teichoic acid biosynthesis glycosyltransferase